MLPTLLSKPEYDVGSVIQVHRYELLTATRAGIDLWQVAQEKLPKGEQEKIFKGKSCDLNLVQALIDSVQRKKDTADDKRWYYEKEDGTRVFYLESALEQLQMYVGIGNIAIQHNPNIVALAWAGFQFLLNVSFRDILTGCLGCSKLLLAHLLLGCVRTH